MMTNILGVIAKRTHSFDIHSVQDKTWLYHCHCRQHLLTIRRHNRVTQGKAKYWCHYCKGQLIQITK